ncbi:MAG: DUF4139 domain-containing protein [Brevinematia bacterium]
MKKLILFFLFAYTFSFAGVAFIYKDVTLIEENISNEIKVLVPFDAKEVVFSKDVSIVAKYETNIYKESIKDYVKEFEEVTNKLEKLKNERKEVEKSLNNSSRKIDMLEKLIVNFPHNQSIKGVETIIEKYYKNFDNELKIANKLRTEIDEIDLKIKDTETQVQRMRKIIDENIVKYNVYIFEKPFNGILKYKIYPAWNIVYMLNKDDNRLDMNMEFKYSKNLEVSVDKIVLINYNNISQNLDKSLRPLRSYLAEKYSKSRLMKSSAPKIMAESFDSAEDNIYVQTVESDVGFIFEVNKKIKLTEKSMLPIITNLIVSTKLNYFAIPLKSSWGYYSMSISNITFIPLIAGRLNLYSKNDSISLNITNTIVENGNYDLSGVEVREIEATRSIIENFTDMPDLLRNTIINKKTIEIKLKNRLSKSIELTVLDRIPLPSEDRIKLKDVKITDKNDNEVKNILAKDGIIEWKMNLKPKEERKIYISYRVEYPKEFNIYESEE